MVLDRKSFPFCWKLTLLGYPCSIDLFYYVSSSFLIFRLYLDPRVFHFLQNYDELLPLTIAISSSNPSMSSISSSLHFFPQLIQAFPNASIEKYLRALLSYGKSAGSCNIFGALNIYFLPLVCWPTMFLRL